MGSLLLALSSCPGEYPQSFLRVRGHGTWRDPETNEESVSKVCGRNNVENTSSRH